MAVGADPRIGSELAGYRIESLLGRGGMSVVYLAEDLRLDRKVALKLLAPELSEDERFRERFLRESKLAASLDHPNVIPIYEAGETGGVLFIAMRYVEGTDLKELLAKDGALEPARAVGIVERAADALDAAHKRGLIHRDVKPGNVLISDEGHVYLSDFGLTKQQTSDSGITETGQFVGTADYVAPEQIERKPVLAASDEYALACVLYECLTGEAPFRSESLMGVLWGHLNTDATPPSERNSELPAEIDPVLAKGMAKEPAERYLTCAELAAEARSALGLSGEFVGPTASTPRRRRRLLLGAGLLLVVAAIAAAFSVIFATGSDEAAVGDDWSKVPHVESVFGGTQGTRAPAVTEGESGLLVAVGSDGRFALEEPGNLVVWTSPDGVNWSLVQDVVPDLPGLQGATAVIAEQSGFLAVGWDVSEEGGKAAVWRSPDGEEWERIEGSEEALAAPGARMFFDVAVGGPGFVAVGTDFGGAPHETRPAVWFSSDGTAWSRVPDDPQVFGNRPTSGDVFGMLRGVAVADDGRVAAVGVVGGEGNSSGGAWVSSDGISWIRAAHEDAVFGDGSNYVTIEDVAAGGPGFVAVGAEGDRPVDLDVETFLGDPGPDEGHAIIWTSSDGLAWSRVPRDQLPGGGQHVVLTGLTTGAPGLVAFGARHEEPGVIDGDINPIVWTSADGETWTQADDPAGVFSQPGGQVVIGATEGGPGLVAIGQDGDSTGFNTAVWTSP